MSSNSNDDRLCTKDYLTEFDAKGYLDVYTTFKQWTWLEDVLKRMMASFLVNKDRLSGAKRGLEFGGGPVLLYSFLLSQFVEEITFTDYTPSNIRQVEEWLQKGPNAYDWSEIFDTVVAEYQQQSGDISASCAVWENNLRNALQFGGLSTCSDVNITGGKCPILDGMLMNPFDIIMSSFCLEDACQSVEMYKRTLKRLHDILKPGGFIFLIHGRNQSFYILNGCKFFALSLNEEDVRQAMLEVGFIDIYATVVEAKGHGECDIDGIIVVSAFKTK